MYTHIDPKTGKAVQNAIYDGNGDVIGHVDFKNHGIESGHYHYSLNLVIQHLGMVLVNHIILIQVYLQGGMLFRRELNLIRL